MSPRDALIGAVLALVLLTVAVSALMLVTRLKEARAKRIHPQAMATSTQMAARLENTQPPTTTAISLKRRCSSMPWWPLLWRSVTRLHGW